LRTIVFVFHPGGKPVQPGPQGGGTGGTIPWGACRPGAGGGGGKNGGGGGGGGRKFGGPGWAGFWRGATGGGAETWTIQGKPERGNRAGATGGRGPPGGAGGAGAVDCGLRDPSWGAQRGGTVTLGRRTKKKKGRPGGAKPEGGAGDSFNPLSGGWFILVLCGRGARARGNGGGGRLPPQGRGLLVLPKKTHDTKKKKQRGDKKNRGGRDGWAPSFRTFWGRRVLGENSGKGGGGAVGAPGGDPGGGGTPLRGGEAGQAQPAAGPGRAGNGFSGGPGGENGGGIVGAPKGWVRGTGVRETLGAPRGRGKNRRGKRGGGTPSQAPPTYSGGGERS